MAFEAALKLTANSLESPFCDAHSVAILIESRFTPENGGTEALTKGYETPEENNVIQRLYQPNGPIQLIPLPLEVTQQAIG